MKKGIITLLLVVSFMVVITGSVFFMIIKYDEKEKLFTGDEIINKELAMKTQRIVITNFDETERVIDVTDDIVNIVNILVNCSYQKLPEDKYVEGFYQIVMLTHEDLISIGITDSYLAYNGEQYIVALGSLADIVDTFVR